MQTQIVDRTGLLTTQAREFAKRRLLFALSRFDSKIDRVRLVLTDLNGSRGGVDKRCQVAVWLVRQSQITVSNDDSDLQACIARAADRIGRAVSRAMTRQTDRSRRGRMTQGFNTAW